MGEADHRADEKSRHELGALHVRPHERWFVRHPEWRLICVVIPDMGDHASARPVFSTCSSEFVEQRILGVATSLEAADSVDMASADRERIPSAECDSGHLAPSRWRHQSPHLRSAVLVQQSAAHKNILDGGFSPIVTCDG
jgi:hypothetical protein